MNYKRGRRYVSGELEAAIKRVLKLKGLDNKAVPILAGANNNAAVALCRQPIHNTNHGNKPKYLFYRQHELHDSYEGTTPREEFVQKGTIRERKLPLNGRKTEHRIHNKLSDWILGLARAINRDTSNNHRRLFDIFMNIAQRKKTKGSRRQQTNDLTKRTNELNCLYTISKIEDQSGANLDNILQQTVVAITQSCRYPEITTARITLKDAVYTVPGFREGRRKLASDIVVYGKPIGSVEVFDLNEKPVVNECSLQKENRSLINEISKRLSNIVERISSEEEKNKLKQQLVQSRETEMVAQLAGGITHDLGNLLTVINGYISLTRKTLPSDHKAVEWLTGVQQATEQAADVTRSLLDVSQKTESKKTPVELQGVATRCLNLLRRVLPPHMNVVINTEGEPVWVLADETQMQRIIMNLSINARDAMPNGGTFKLSVSKSCVETNNSDLIGKNTEWRAKLIASDTGSGINPELRKRLFEPFFTTKPGGKHAGLGLTVINSIVRDHDGIIKVESEQGKGTTFTLEFPLLPLERYKRNRAKHTPSPTRGGGEVIFLIGNSSHLRSILTTSLESMNYRVVQANSENGFVDCLKQHCQQANLLIIDIDYSRHSEVDCLHKIRSIDCHIPVIVITGNTDTNAAVQFDSDTILLRKPFQINELHLLVGNALARTYPITG